MKRLLALGLLTVLALPSSSAVVFAVEGSQTNQTTTTQTTEKAETEIPKTPAELKAIADRVAAKKAELKTKLTAAQKVRIQTKCKASQGLVSSISGRVKGIETSRTQVHKNIVSRLTGLSEKLKNKGVNTDELNTAIADLESKITLFNTDLATYKLAVSDLAAMDCKTDPDGFKAALEAARTAREKVSQDFKAIRSHVQDTIKPLLKTIRAQLESNTPEEDQ